MVVRTLARKLSTSSMSYPNEPLLHGEPFKLCVLVVLDGLQVLADLLAHLDALVVLAGRDRGPGMCP